MIVLKSSRENIGQYEKAEAVVLFLCKECADHIRMLGLPEDFYEAVAYQIKTQGYGFTDKGSITSALMKTGSGFTRLIFAGVGAGKECTPNHLRMAAGNAARELQKCKIKQAVAAAPLLTNPKRGHYLKALAEGLLLGSYTFDKYKSKKDTGETGGSNNNEEVNSGVPGAVGGNEENISITVFTVIENGKRAGLDRMLEVCRELDFTTVPIEEVDNDLPAKYPTVEALLERADGNYPNGGKKEGIVIRPTEPVYSSSIGAELSMQVVSNKYLLKNDN
jgi:leucyl aminopeptidase